MCMSDLGMEHVWTAAEISLVDRARVFALAAHSGQTRAYTEEPYINHPAEVAAIIRGVGGSPTAVAMAWLHDVVEDTNVGIETVVEEFGPDVGIGVYHLSHALECGWRSVRRSIDLMHMGTLSPEEASVKVADIISNTKTIAKRAKADTARVYLREKSCALDLLEMLGASPALVKIARRQVEDGERSLEKVFH